MTDFVKAIATSFHFLLGLFAFSTVLYLSSHRKFAKGLMAVALLLFFAVSTPYLPTYLASRLEGQYRVLRADEMTRACGPDTYVVVLAAGHRSESDLPALQRLELTSLGRLVEAVRLQRICANAKIVCSGYTRSGGESQADVTRQAAIELGVAGYRLETMPEPKSTLDEVQYFQEKYPDARRLVVVTDAIHMPRAMFFFERIKIPLLAAPTNFRTGGTARWVFLPSLNNIQLMDLVIHEYLGRLKYYLIKSED